MNLQGVEYYKTQTIPDSRGSFTKLFNEGWRISEELRVSEIFTSYSTRSVVRGMHLQVGKRANWRVISVVNGSAFDVLIDLRSNSETYGLIISKILESQGTSTVVVPPGVAHGFQALENTQLIYVTTCAYDADFDTGVSVSSLEIDWPIPNFVLSDRDKSLPNLSEWKSGKLLA